ncbi:MAG: CRISPR-associated protein Cas5 [Puniceicoccales bacterium]|jgi:CRISPR-associated protein Cas5d|nr:CRISPR-associated protein Cas5 [Puniceicoccales bacterium]
MPYPIQLEISGPTAMWTRPDTGAAPVSAVVPSPSAAKGIFESVLRWKSVNIVPTRVEICRPVQFHRYATNYGGPLRKSDQIKSGASFQQHAIVLINVCYRLYADVTFAQHYAGDKTRGQIELRRDKSKRAHGFTTCPQHAFQDAFNRALRRGTFHAYPCLGLSDFPADYAGEFRPETKICETENHVIPTLLKSVFNGPQSGKWKPTFLNNLIVRNGVLEYSQNA